MNRSFAGFLAAALAVGLAAAPAMAQGQGRGRGGFGGGPVQLLAVPAVQTRLSITADQKTKLEAIQTKMREERQAAFQAGDPQAAREKLRELNQKAEGEVMAILTADQKTKLQAVTAEHEQYQGLGRPSYGLLAVTDLTADQKTRLGELARTTQEKRRAAFQGGGGQGGGRERLQAFEAETATAVKAILTSAQHKAFDDGLAAAPRGFGGGRRRQNQ
jgi:Spy/CpxP family protein refolding chaperone